MPTAANCQESAPSPCTLLVVVGTVHMAQRTTRVAHSPFMLPRGWNSSTAADYGLTFMQPRSSTVTSQCLEPCGQLEAGSAHRAYFLM